MEKGAYDAFHALEPQPGTGGGVARGLTGGGPHLMAVEPTVAGACGSDGPFAAAGLVVWSGDSVQLSLTIRENKGVGKGG